MLTLCANCGKTFDKRNADYNWTERNHLRHFCSRNCSMVVAKKEITPETYQKNIEQLQEFNKQHPEKNYKNLITEFSPFKYYLTKAKTRSKKTKINIDLTLEYLKNLWELQDNGVCPYSKIKMILPKTTNQHKGIRSLKKASLDRIDSSKGYIQGNVEFICLGINLLKNDFTKEETISFFQEAVNK